MKNTNPNPKFEFFTSGSTTGPAYECRWRLRAKNREIIAQSEGYTTMQGARRGAKAVERAILRIVSRRLAEKIQRDTTKNDARKKPKRSRYIAVGSAGGGPVIEVRKRRGS